MVQSEHKKNRLSRTFSLAFTLSIIFGFLYLIGIIVEDQYMAYRYIRTEGTIVNVRHELRHFSEHRAVLDDLGPGYVSNDIESDENVSEFLVYRYEFFLGGYFHVIYDENGKFLQRAPTGFRDFF